MTDTTKLAGEFRARVQNYSLEALGNWAYSHRDEIEAALRTAPAADRKNTPIADLLAMYADESCDFANMDWVRSSALRYVETMPDSQVRCLLYTLANNGPAACSALVAPPSSEGVGSAGSGAAPIGGLADAIAGASDWLAGVSAPWIDEYEHVKLLIAAARAYQEAAAELARVKGERDAAIERLVWSAICWDDAAIVFRNCDRFDDANECDENAAQCRALAASTPAKDAK